METKYYTPYELEKGVNYFLESGIIKWYISNNSEKGSLSKTGFSINTNSGYNSKSCYYKKECQFFSLSNKNNPHAYSNCCKNPQFRRLTTDEEIWFRECKKQNKFIPFDDVIKHSIVTLKEFPSSGVCWNPTQELQTFLMKKFQQGYKQLSKGLAWNNRGYWTVSSSSSQPEYTIEQLEPFLIPEHVKHYPLTPDQCDFPEKWSLNITLENKHLVKRFLYSKKEEYIGYSPKWIPTEDSTFFYPQHTEGAYCVRGNYHKIEGYTFITNEQIIKHVLTHTDNKQINNSKTQKDEYKERERTTSISCKIPRFNFSVRDTDPIRGIGLKCSKIQIKVGSGHLPD